MLVVQVLILLRQQRRSERPNNPVLFRNNDFVAGDFLQIMRNRGIIGNAALKNDRAAITLENLTDAGHDRPRLGFAGAADDFAQRKTVFELVDGRCAQHGTDTGKFQTAVIVGSRRHFLDRHIEFYRHTVQKRSGAGGADAAHFAVPHVGFAVEDHRLAVLPPNVKNCFAFRIKTSGAGNVGSDFADLKVVRNKVVRVLHDLTAGHAGTADAGQRINSTVFEEAVHRLPELTEIAGPAAIAAAAAAHPAGIRRFGSLVQRIEDIAGLVQQHKFKRG